MKITATQHDNGIMLTTDGSPISTQRKVSFKTKIPGQPETENTITYLSDAALTATISNPKPVYMPGDRIELVIGGGNVPYSVYSPDSGIVVTQDPSIENIFYIDVNVVTNKSVNIEVRDSDVGRTSVALTLDKFNNINVIEEPTGRHYNREDIYFVAQGASNEVICTCDDPNVIVERSRSIDSRFRVYLNDDTNQGTNTFIRFNSLNENEVEMPLNILPLVDIRLSPKVSPVKPGEDFVMIAENVPENLEAYSSTREVSVKVEKQPITGTYHIICSCNKDIDSNISVFGRGINDTKFVASFIKSDQFYLGEKSIIVEQIKLPYKVKVFGAYENVTVKSDNPEVECVYDDLNKWVIISSKNPNYTQEISAFITLTHPNQNDVELPVILVPSKDSSKPDMGLNNKVITKPVGLEFFINTPILTGNDIISATCDDPDCTVSVYPDRGNRVYIKSDVIKEYKITIKHTDYRDAVLTFNCVDSNAVPSVQPPVVNKPVYDLGVPPSTNVNVKSLEYVSTAFKDVNLPTDENKCAYVIANGPAEYKLVGNVVCDSAIKLDSKSSKLVPLDEVKMIKELYSTIDKVLNYKDYIEFQESLLLILKLFKIYKDRGLNKEVLFRSNKYWGYDSFSLDDYVRTIRFLTDYVEKDGQNMNPYEYSFTSDVTYKLVDFCKAGIRP